MPILKYDGTPAGETIPTGPIYRNDGVQTGTSQNETFWGSQTEPGRVMIGGAGDDFYYLGVNSDRAQEAPNAGNDTIAGWRNMKLADYPNFENVSALSDRASAFGNDGDNIVSGGDGMQTLYGGKGQDVLVGGAGADTFVVIKGEGNDVIQDFSVAQGDVVRLQAGLGGFADVQRHMTQVGADVKIDLGGGDGLILRNVQASQLTAANFHVGVDTAQLGAMTFHDEFNGPLSLWDKESAPTGVWRPDWGYQGVNGVGSYTLQTASELQINTSPYFRGHNGDFSESPFVSNGDGTLSIWTKASSNPEIFGYNYISGSITTKESFAQQYGYFEMRADLPNAPGTWPGFWLVPNNGAWPPEIDVLEQVADKDVAYQTSHWKDLSQPVDKQHQQLGGANQIFPNGEGFHTFGLLWTKTELVWYLDGAEVFRSATHAGMDTPMHIIANVALGGWGGAPDPSQYPTEMKIDYIRAYALADGSSITTGGTSNSAGLAGGAPTGGTSGGTTGGTTGGGSTGGTSTGGTGTGTTTNTGGGFPSGGSSGGSSGGTAGSGSTLHASAAGGVLQGSENADTIAGGDAYDYLRGNGGGDLITGGGEHDDLNGNAGNDTVSGGLGDDWVVGGKDADQLSGDDGNDIVYGNMGDDHCDGGVGDDTVRGGQDNDVVLGGDGRDWLSGDKGVDTVTGGAGADVFHISADAGIDYVTDFNAAEGDRIQLDVGSHYTISASGSDTVITIDGQAQMVLQNVLPQTFDTGWIFMA